MTEEIRPIIREHGCLPVDVHHLAVNADLHQAGMTCLASVNVAPEDRRDVELPDRMLCARLSSSR